MDPHRIKPNMETAKTYRRSTSAAVPRSPVLRRSISGDSTAPHSTFNRASRSATSSPRPSIERSRSKSNAKERRSVSAGGAHLEKCGDIGRQDGKLQTAIAATARRLTGSECSSPVTRLRRPSPQNVAMRRISSMGGSPSAWALSSGRPPSSPSSPSPSLSASHFERTLMVKSTPQGGVGGVLRYFQKPKKASPEEKLGIHMYGMMSNRLLQWRFANAKSEAATLVITTKSEEKLFAVWLKVCKMRNTIAEKQSRLQRLRLKIKLLGIITPQILLLNQWEILEKRNCEAVGRVTRKLSAYATKIPLVNGAKMDIADLFDLMRSALNVLQDIEDHVTKFLFHSEELCDLLRELVCIAGENENCFLLLHKAIFSVMSLEAKEKSLRAHLVQSKPLRSCEKPSVIAETTRLLNLKARNTKRALTITPYA